MDQEKMMKMMIEEMCIRDRVSTMSENNKFVSWVKAHKTELIIAGVTVVGAVLVVKNWD